MDINTTPDGKYYKTDADLSGRTATYTAVVGPKGPNNEGSYEELDILVPSSRAQDVRPIALAALARDYQPDTVVKAIKGPRVGLYM